MRRLSVLGVPPQLVFLGLGIFEIHEKQKISFNYKMKQNFVKTGIGKLRPYPQTLH